MSLLNINAVHTFLQIVQNSRKPLEVIREAIANAYDSGSEDLKIKVEYDREKEWINLLFEDNGNGISKKDIEHYIFGLGNSTKLNARGIIGNKGVGTLLFLKSKRIIVTSFKDGQGAKQEWINPYESLVNIRNNDGNYDDITRKKIGIQEAKDFPYSGKNGTIIEIQGFLHKNPLEYHHKNLVDFIKWFTKTGSFEKEMGMMPERNFKIHLKGLEFKEDKKLDSVSPKDIILTGNGTYIIKDNITTRKEFSQIDYGFKFPDVSKEEEIVENYSLSEMSSNYTEKDLDKDLKKYIRKYLVMKFTSKDMDTKEKNLLEFTYKDSLGKTQTAIIEFVVYRIGEEARKSNKMIKDFTNQLPSYKYIVSKRYGIYLAKDYIPVQLINDDLQSVGEGGHGKTQYLGFFNCQKIDLTIDRTGAATIDEELQTKLISNINELMVIIDKCVKEKVNELIENIKHKIPPKTLKSLSENANELVNKVQNNPEDKKQKQREDYAEISIENEKQKKKKRHLDRIQRINNKRKLIYKTQNGNDIVLREPMSESELYGTLMQVITLEPNIIPFEIMDYDTIKGFDILSVDRISNEAKPNDFFYVELKWMLTEDMNHTLEDAKFIICWMIGDSLRKKNVLRDKAQHLYILEQNNEGFFLERNESNKSKHSVRIIELKELIQQHFGQFI
ncbi:ATP-binding protein [Priestia sp. SIMBA_032]|uniref:ATP-binding protein n=1 Tax=Priestia sp. SIMBA_032 TaxID=3085775 RepID=UPI00397C66A2